jgi:hypothetical protein
MSKNITLYAVGIILGVHFVTELTSKSLELIRDRRVNDLHGQVQQFRSTMDDCRKKYGTYEGCSEKLEGNSDGDFIEQKNTGNPWRGGYEITTHSSDFELVVTGVYPQEACEQALTLMKKMNGTKATCAHKSYAASILTVSFNS